MQISFQFRRDFPIYVNDNGNTQPYMNICINQNMKTVMKYGYLTSYNEYNSASID